jgi:hypothetical protein
MPSTLRITARPFEDFRVRHESELAALYKRTRAASWKITEEQWAAAIYSGAISQASQAGGAEQELATKAYLSSLHARDLALALAVRLGRSDAIEHFAIEYMWLLRGLAEHITDDNGRVIALTKEVFDELCGPQNVGGRRKSIFDNFDGRVSLITWLREFAIRRETGRPPTAAEIRLQPSDIRRDMRAEFLGFLELLDTLGAAPEVLPRHRFASRLWLAPLAVLVVALISVKAATTRQSQRFATPSLSGTAENHGDRGVLQPTSREAPFEFEQSTFTSASSDVGLGSDSSGSQSRQADQFAGDIEILFSPGEAGARFDATRVSDTREFAATAPTVAAARQKSPLADRTISRSASNSAVTKPDQVVRVEEARYATNRAWLTRSTLSLSQLVMTKWRKIERANSTDPNWAVQPAPDDKLPPPMPAALGEKSASGAEPSAALSTASYVEAKVDAYRLGNSGFGTDSRKTEERKPSTFGDAASPAVALSDSAAGKPITIASTGHLTTWVLISGGVINRSTDGVRWQPLSSGTDRDLIAGAAPSAEVCWVVGRAGTILRTTDGEQWERIPSPAEADLLSVAAADEYSATVLTADGRRFATDNVGKTWQLKVPNAGPELSRNARPKGSRIVAVSPASKAVKSRVEPRKHEATPMLAPKRSATTGTFAGQLFGYAGGHIFSTDLTLTLVGAGKEVKGAWASVQGKSGKVTGTLAGSNIASMRLEQLEPCAGSYAGSAVIVEDGQRLHGSYTGTDCKGQVDASFIVVRH